MARRELIQSFYNALEIFVILTTLCVKQARITSEVQECFYTISGM